MNYMREKMMNLEMNVMRKVWAAKEKICGAAMEKEAGIDGILVTVGLCIIALLLCVVMKDSLTTFITSIVTSMTKKAQTILAGALLL